MNSHRCSFCVGRLIVLCLGTAICAPAAEPQAGSFLKRQGTDLQLNGKPLRLVSVNGFDLFLSFLSGPPSKTQAVEATADIARRGFNVVRVCGVGFYPNDMRGWASEKHYWGAFDELVQAAKAHGIRLIPTICWNVYMFPDMAGECVQDMMLNPDSRSRQYLWLYTHQIVSRYRNEPTILFWELTNELNLHADLAFQSPYGFGGLNPTHEGCAFIRVRRDHFTTEQMIGFVREWAGFIQSLDGNHMIGSGFSAPRPAAQHLRLAQGRGDWTADNREEMTRYLRDSHPDPIELISIHFYPGHDNLRFGNRDELAATPLVVFKEACDHIGKPMYLGETGDEYTHRPTVPFLKDSLDHAVRLRVPLTLVWNWACRNEADVYNVRKAPETLKLMQQANERFAAAATRP